MADRVSLWIVNALVFLAGVGTVYWSLKMHGPSMFGYGALLVIFIVLRRVC